MKKVSNNFKESLVRATTRRMAIGVIALSSAYAQASGFNTAEDVRDEEVNTYRELRFPDVLKRDLDNYNASSSNKPSSFTFKEVDDVIYGLSNGGRVVGSPFYNKDSSRMLFIDTDEYTNSPSDLKSYASESLKNLKNSIPSIKIDDDNIKAFSKVLSRNESMVTQKDLNGNLANVSPYAMPKHTDKIKLNTIDKEPMTLDVNVINLQNLNKFTVMGMGKSREEYGDNFGRDAKNYRRFIVAHEVCHLFLGNTANDYDAVNIRVNTVLGKNEGVSLLNADAASRSRGNAHLGEVISDVCAFSFMQRGLNKEELEPLGDLVLGFRQGSVDRIKTLSADGVQASSFVHLTQPFVKSFIDSTKKHDFKKVESLSDSAELAISYAALLQKKSGLTFFDFDKSLFAVVGANRNGDSELAEKKLSEFKVFFNDYNSKTLAAGKMVNMNPANLVNLENNVTQTQNNSQNKVVEPSIEVNAEDVVNPFTASAENLEFATSTQNILKTKEPTVQNEIIKKTASRKFN